MVMVKMMMNVNIICMFSASTGVCSFDHNDGMLMMIVIMMMMMMIMMVMIIMMKDVNIICCGVSSGV